MFENLFFTDRPESRAAWRKWMETTLQALEAALPRQPYRGDSIEEIGRLFDGGFLPAEGRPPAEIFRRLGEVVERSLAVWHPHTVAHLHCPVLLPALAAEVVISALNQSMDSFDQAPAASVLEQRLTEWLCTTAGLSPKAGATFTSGGTQSNYMGLLLARDAFSARYWKHSTREQGLHSSARRLRILCSRFTHFSVAKSAFQLGLGNQAIVPVDTDRGHRMNPRSLRDELVRLRREGSLPFAIVATAGTTDFGSIDPLAEIAAVAEEAGVWFHVDAAYGGALLLSNTHRGKLDGIGKADSISIDFHKAFYQPISCSAFLVSDARHFDLIRVNADYLNPEGHEAEGFLNLVDRSLSTTRRFDALKLWMTLQAVGGEKFSAMIDRTIELAELLFRHLEANPKFEVLARPDYGCVVFRFRWPADPAEEERLNDQIPKRLFQNGDAVLGHTRVDERSCLKMTLLNPCTPVTDLYALLDRIEACGREIVAEKKVGTKH